MDDFQAVCHCYDDIIEENTGTKYDVYWRRDLHPSDAQIEAAIKAGELYLGILDGGIACVSIVNGDFAPGYERVPWNIDVPWDQAKAVHLFGVHPSYQKRGLGVIFLEAIANASREKGIKTLRLDVLDHNTPGLHLYEKAGYKCCGPMQLDYEDQASKSWVFIMYDLVL